MKNKRPQSLVAAALDRAVRKGKVKAVFEEAR